MYRYKVYGIYIASELEMPQWIAAEGESQVSITLGDVILGKIVARGSVDDLDPEILQAYCYFPSRSEFICNIENVVKFQVKNGDSVVVELYPNADLNLARAYLAGKAMGILLMQRGMLAIHGACLDIGGWGVIISGESGAGKSTLSSALRERGYGFLADDVSVITWDDAQQPLVQPAFPRSRLLGDAAEQLGYDVSALPWDGDKYAVPADGFRAEPIPWKAMVELQVGEQASVELRKITGTKKISLLQNNIYGLERYERLGVSPEYIWQYIEAVKDIAAFSLIRPEGKYSVEEQMALVIEALSGQL